MNMKIFISIVIIFALFCCSNNDSEFNNYDYKLSVYKDSLEMYRRELSCFEGIRPISIFKDSIGGKYTYQLAIVGNKLYNGDEFLELSPIKDGEKMEIKRKNGFVEIDFEEQQRGDSITIHLGLVGSNGGFSFPLEIVVG